MEKTAERPLNTMKEWNSWGKQEFINSGSLAVSIGEMIEFLEDDFIIQKPTVGYSKWFIESLGMKEIRSSELCNLLWEAVKYKLKEL